MQASVFVPNSESVGFDPWGRGVVTGKCTPRKTGTVLEHLGTLLEPSWNLAGTVQSWNLAGTSLEPCWNFCVSALVTVPSCDFGSQDKF